MVTFFLLISFVFMVWVAIEIGNSRPWYWTGKWPPSNRKKINKKRDFYPYRPKQKSTTKKYATENLTSKPLANDVAAKAGSTNTQKIRILDKVKYPSSATTSEIQVSDEKILLSFIEWSKKFNELTLYNRYVAATKYTELFEKYHVRDYSLITDEYLVKNEPNICCYTKNGTNEIIIACNLLWDWLRRIPHHRNIGENLFELNHQTMTDITDRTFEEYIRECTEEPDLFNLLTSTKQANEYWKS